MKSNKPKKKTSIQKYNAISQGLNKSAPLREEEVEVKIPTPYPQAQYMTLDQTLQNSKYTAILNEKYPPRKYLKHNKTSYSKTTNNNDLKFTLLNPKINFSDYNLKSVTYNGKDLDEINITSIEEAKEIIDRLKGKLIEYELVNNENIQKAKEIIEKMKKEKEFLIKKIDELYDNISIITEKFGVDPENPDPNDINNLRVNRFRNKSLKRNFINFFKKRVKQIIDLKRRYEKIKKKKELLLKLKAFISFEKNVNIKNFTRNIEQKRENYNIKYIFQIIKDNLYFNKLNLKFFELQKNIFQLIYLKKLKAKTYISKRHSINNKKALLFYYNTMIKKVLKILRVNALHNSKKKIDSINYNRFVKSLTKKYKKEELEKIKHNKIYGMQKLKKFVEKGEIILKSKLINSDNKKNHLILSYYFDLWKIGSEEYYKEITLKMKIKSNMIKSFFNAVQVKRRLKHYELIPENENVKKIYVNFFLKKIIKEINFKKLQEFAKKQLPKKIKKYLFFKLLNLAKKDPLLKFIKLRKRTELLNFIMNCKNSFENTKKDQIILKSKESFLKVLPMLKKKIFFSNLKRNLNNEKGIKKLFKKKLLTNFLRKLQKAQYKHKEKSIRGYYEKTISYIKQILNEKTSMINQLQYDNDELTRNYESISSKMNHYSNENEALRKNLYESKYQNEIEKKKLHEILQQNQSDINCLKLSIENNERLLNEAVKREELLQKKYCNDIQNAIKLNKNLNEIISKKNMQLLELNNKKNKENEFLKVEDNELTTQKSTKNLKNLTYQYSDY